MPRNTLPNRRPCDTFEIDHDGLHYTVSVGYDNDKQPMEVFVNCSRLGTAADASVRDAAIAVSLALQHGAPLKTLAHAMTKESNGKASSAIGRILDLVVGS